MELIVIIGLLVVVVAQACFYMWQVQVLTNKLMSGSYAAYAAIEDDRKRPLIKIPVSAPANDFNDLAELNQLVGANPF